MRPPRTTVEDFRLCFSCQQRTEWIDFQIGKIKLLIDSVEVEEEFDEQLLQASIFDLWQQRRLNLRLARHLLRLVDLYGNGETLRL